jgi:EF-P beta-lysylation protein EpmB
VRDPVDLCRRLQLPAHCESAAIRASRDFPVFAPLSYIARMQPGDPHDPLLRQVLPLDDELAVVQGFTADPVGDLAAQRDVGLLHKYHGRALMITTGVCAVHCRFCFRRQYPYEDSPSIGARWPAAVAQIAGDPSLQEVILSGGDPLTLGDTPLAELAAMLAAIPHVRRLRVHTRLPIMIPQRVTDELVGWLRGTRLTPVMVVHANHARELDTDVESALGRLADAGIPVLNQAVLLRGVNDHADTLVELSQRLLDCRVLPYYLHQLDRVAGAAHFETPVEVGQRLIAEMTARLPGYAVPRYVREVPGAPAKLRMA